MVSTSDIVRFSKVGDQFHYRWAARRCLGLLDPGSRLDCITIEGVSSDEEPNENTGTGEEVVDVAEYYGDSTIKLAEKISYHQLKHSCKVSPSTLSALSKTLKGFFKRFEAWKKEAEDIERQQVEFTFTTNRPMAKDVHQLVDRIKKRTIKSDDIKKWNKIKKYLDTEDDTLAYEFFSNFRIDDCNDVHWEQRNILIQELGGYIAGSDKDGADHLWRLVVEKALPGSREITREDVLRVLNTNESELFPAPCLIKDGEEHFAREQEDEYLHKILASDHRPMIIHAEGGVGKTALARRISRRMPDHSVAILYDCFGNGAYRNASKRRDEHSVGLVQISNELAALKLCYPLIPSVHAKPADYLRAFNYRLKQAVNVLKGGDPDAKLVLLIDAADNAEMAAEEYRERASFVKDLIREKLTDGVVPVFLCRTHRIKKLDTPPDYCDLPLQSLSESETEILLKKRFPEATRNDIREFHRLSSQNPRVQAMALEKNLDLPQTLLMLGPDPTTVEDTIRNIFEQSLRQLLDNLPKSEVPEVNILCESLAALRPFIPIEVLSLASGMDEGAIRSFLVDLGRPLSLTGNAVQFFDEPSETWFRENYKPTKDKLITFIDRIKPLATENSYVASALPQLMLEAGQYDELVELALGDENLPTENPIDRRNVSLQRLQFALKAALRMKRYDDAAKLALKAGGETAGNDRQEALIQANTDLISHLLPGYSLREIIDRKTFSTSWHGGHYAYEACLLSGCEDTLPESRSYLRLAYRWVDNWSGLSKKDRKTSEINDNDIAEMAMCELNLNGAKGFIGRLSLTSRSVAYRAGSIVIRRLVDLGKYDLIDQIAAHSSGNPFILLAIVNEQNPVLRYSDSVTAKIVLDSLGKYAQEIEKNRTGLSPVLSVVNSVVQAAIVHKVRSYGEIADILDIYIPPPETYYFSRHSDEPRFTILRANCLRAALREEDIGGLSDLAKPNIKKLLENKNYYHDRDTQDFLEDVRAVLPWHKLWTDALLGKVEPKNIDKEIEKCRSVSNSAAHIYHRDDCATSEEISRLWIEILLLIDSNSARMEKFFEWKSSLKQKMLTPALIRLARLCTHKKNAYTFVQEAFDIIDQDRMDAEQKVDSYIDISRAICALDPEEAKYYFDQAVKVAGRIGQENLDRWSSLLELSLAASEPNKPQPELSYRLSRAAELVYQYIDNKHYDWEEIIEGITKLCPSSSLAILSRWKDRSFCRVHEQFPRVIRHLVELEQLAPSTALALIGYQYDWSNTELVQSAINSVKDKERQKALFEHALRYIEVRGAEAGDWKYFTKTAAQKGWKDYDFSPYLRQSEAKEILEERKNSGSLNNYEPKPDPLKDWDNIFQNLDPISTASIQASYRRFNDGDPPFHTERFSKQLFDRVLSGSEANALSAIFNIPDFSLYNLRDIYEAIPENWLSRNHIRTSLAKITENVCKTHFYKIAKSRYYQALPYEVITRCSGVTEQQIYQWVVEASAENPLILGSGRLFSLVGLIAPDLTKQQAADTLDYGLKLLEQDMNKTDGDGDWSSGLHPPTEVDASLAGYIWISLGSPHTAERWEAAHVVCLLCAFDCQDVLDHLLIFANGGDPASFHDLTLPFYNLSAKLWLLIALRRALKLGNTKAVLRFESFVRQACNQTECHVMLRGISAKILLELHCDKAIKLTKKEVERLQSINASKREVVVSDSYSNKIPVETPGPKSDENKCYFRRDISEYWFKPLGQMFAFGTDEIEHRVNIIQDEFHVFEQDGRNDDPRHKRRLYGESELGHSHGSYPCSEDLSFYHSYHAMMMVAGKLIDTARRYQYKEYPDELEEWIDRHQLTRADGLWLADRRDPKPTEVPKWKSDKEIDNWCSSVTKDRLLDAIEFGDEKICVWGRWNYSDSSRKESINISSALVNTEHAHSLLRTLQTTPNPHDYYIPTSGDELEINSGPYQLKGWILETSEKNRIDEYDPWAGDILYPPLHPAKWFIKKIDLQSDYERRFWRSSTSDEKPILFSYTWGRKPTKNDYVSPESGSRLIVDKGSLKSWLSSIDMDMIIEIKIRRDHRQDSYQQRQEETAVPYTLIVIFRANGKIETL